METYLNGDLSKPILWKDESLIHFYEMFAYLSGYNILWPHTNYLFQIDIEYIKQWYSRYGEKVQWEMVDVIYSHLYTADPPQIDRTVEEDNRLWNEFKTKLDLYKITIYGFDINMLKK